MPIYPKYLEPTSLKCKLYKSTLDFDPSYQYRADIDSHASTGTNVDVKSCTVTGTYASPFFTVDIDDLTWFNLTSTDIRYAVFYEDTGSDATDRLFFYLDAGSTKTPINATVSVQFAAGGLVRFDVT